MTLTSTRVWPERSLPRLHKLQWALLVVAAILLVTWVGFWKQDASFRVHGPSGTVTQVCGTAGHTYLLGVRSHGGEPDGRADPGPEVQGPCKAAAEPNFWKGLTAFGSGVSVGGWALGSIWMSRRRSPLTAVPAPT